MMDATKNASQQSDDPDQYQYGTCGLSYGTTDEMPDHCRTRNSIPCTFVETQRALNGAVRCFAYDSTGMNLNDLSKLLHHIQRDLTQLLKTIASTGHHKVGMVIMAECGNMDQQGDILELLEMPIRSGPCIELVDSNVMETLQTLFISIGNILEDLRDNGAHFDTIQRFVSIRLECARCKPLDGKCNLLSVTMTKQLRQSKMKKGEITKNDCFYRAIAFHFVKKEEEIEAFMNKFINRLHASDEPVEVREITKFEQINPKLSLRIHVLHMDGDESVYPIRTSSNKQGKHLITVVHYSCRHNDKGISHYSLVTDLGKFIRKTYRNAKGKKTYQKCFPCPNCFQKLSSPQVLEEHMAKCIKNEPQIVVLPKKNETITFKNHTRKFKKQFIGFFSLKTPTSETKCTKCSNNFRCDHKSEIDQDHLGLAYCLIILNQNYDIVFERHYVGNNCDVDLQDALIQAQNELKGITESVVNEHPTDSEMNDHMHEQKCHVCEKPFASRREHGDDGFDDTDDDTDTDTDEPEAESIVMDRCRITGKILGAAHKACTIETFYSKLIPIYSHNFSHEATRTILTSLKFSSNLKRAEGLPLNNGRLRSLQIFNFNFLDSKTFLQGSLEELLDDLIKSKEAYFPVLKQMASFAKGKKSKHLFLRDTTACERVSFEINMRHDAAVLADVFIKFRELMYSKFQLDLCHYYSLPGFAYDSMFKLTGVEIEHIGNMEMFLMLSQNIRGEASIVSNRLNSSQTESHTEVHNDRLIQIPSKRNNMLHLKANNLYGMAESRMLPIGEYTFLERREIQNLDLDSLDENDAYGYILMVDLEYPSVLHKSHRSFPLAPERVTVTQDMLSSYQQQCQPLSYETDTGISRLSATFFDRKEYVVHYVTLKLYLSLGMKLTKIHRVIKFRQSKFLKTYVDVCTQLRQNSKTDYGKRTFKFMTDCVYGKFIENTDRHQKVMFAESKRSLEKQTTNPQFLGFDIVSPNLVAGYMKPSKVVPKQAYAIGFTILEYSKEAMYRAFYNNISPAFNGKCEVLMSTSDTLLVSTEFSRNPFEKILNILDTSNFESDHPLANQDRHLSIEYFQSETGSKQVRHFIGLRSKCFAMDTEGTEGPLEHRKQIPQTSFWSYIQDILSDGYTQDQIRDPIQSVNQALIEIKNRRLGFSRYDGKRYVLPCGIHTLPYGSCEIEYNSVACSFCPLTYDT
ncbi:uncharacterized protein LOC131889166 [Tigriopus californicus]|uniref:uncharacterized protein LOC131889166 n=1 Tax=Tigriopus californicus TaxID=6832 RepID=UPI0027DA6EC2|nr:uncharacterized protein LOC131889166 [Tigriopus californicus]